MRKSGIFRHGTGMEQVVRYQMVTAAGQILHVTKDNVTEASTGTLVKMPDNTDLFRSLRGAGASMGIVTEFLYKVYSKPETLPIVVPVFINSKDDFERLIALAEEGQFGVLMTKGYHWSFCWFCIEVSSSHSYSA